VTHIYKNLALFGFVINMHQVCMLARYNIKLSGLDDFGLNVNDVKLQDIVGESGYNPYENEMSVGLTLLQNKCKLGLTITKLKSYCKSVKPDLLCLKNAIANNTIPVIRYLIEEHGIKPDMQCLEDAIYKGATSAVIKLLFDEFKKQYVKNMVILENYQKKSFEFVNFNDDNNDDNNNDNNNNDNKHHLIDLDSYQQITINDKNQKINNDDDEQITVLGSNKKIKKTKSKSSSKSYA
jgi:hypothetical protein